MNKTKIPWVKNPDGSQGYTWNPITGCLNGCEYCYARKLANTRLKERYLANRNWDTRTPEGYDGYPNLDPFYPRFWEDRMRWLVPRYAGSRHLSKPRGIFVCDMADLFGKGILEEWTRRVLEACALWPEHRFYLLTKQPQELPKWSPFPDNCWVGVTATNFLRLESAVEYLSEVEATIKYISAEPLESSFPNCEKTIEMLKGGGINWVIIGAQTKPYKPPKVEWVRGIVEACDNAGIPVFLKDNLKRLILSEAYSAGRWAFKDYKLRQEMPKVGVK